jgi:hypothetical protein
MPRRVALFVGVDEYQDRNVRSLKGAVSDARELCEFFRLKDPFDSYQLLENPICDDLYAAFDELTRNLGEGDFFLFFFAGHGGINSGGQKLLCKNTRNRNGVLHSPFDLNLVTQPQEWDVAAILDACRTDLDRNRGDDIRCGDERDLAFYKGIINERRNRGDDSGSISILCSCDTGKTAGEYTDENGVSHGIFTSAMLQVLRDADAKHDELNFGDKLGNAIARSMKMLAKKNLVGSKDQRPWIQASGDPPLFFRPRLNLESLRNWVDVSLTDDPGVQHRCLAELYTRSASPCGKGILETVRFFSNWEQERQNSDCPHKVAATLLKHLCDAAGSRHEAPPPVDVTPSVAETTASSARPLSDEERGLVRTVVDGVCPHWRSHEGLQGLWTDLSNAGTESEALEAIRKIGDCVRDEFLGENEHRGEKAKQGEIRFRLLSAVIKQQSLDQAVRDCQRFSQSKPNNALLAELRGLLRMFGAFCLPSRSSDFN